MFAKKKQLKELITEKITKALEDQKKEYDKKMSDLEDRVRGECELIIQSKEADIELLTIKLKDADERVKEAEETYYFCWELVSKTASSSNKAELYYGKLEKAMSGILQSIRIFGKEIEDNKQLMINRDADNRKKLRLNGDLKKQIV
jgi:glucan-binding YG repeat protein